MSATHLYITQMLAPSKGFLRSCN